MTLAIVDRLGHLQTMIELVKSKDIDSEQVFIINNIDWKQYENLLESVADDAGVLFKYWEGTLVIMSPSIIHEFYKENIGILIRVNASYF